MPYTNIAKPTGATYTNVAKPTRGFTISVGMATGLICPPTYSLARTIGQPYTNINKPTGSSYTNILKPT